MKGKKIVLIAILIIILLGVGTAFAYFKTDLFKSDEELFYKYLLDIDVELDDKYTSKIKSAKALKLTGDFGIKLETNSSDMAAVETILNGAKINYEYASDKATKQQANITLNFKDKEIANAKYLRNDDVYGIYLKDVLTGYLTIENNNLKELAKKLGITDVTNIPDKIEIPTDSILNIDDETKNYIIEKYITVIKQNIAEDKYIKTKEEIIIDGTNVDCNKYTLSLSEQEINNLAIEILKVLKEDNKTLDFLVKKVKSIYGQMLEQEIDKEILKENIQDEIDTLIQQNIENNNILSLSVYVNNKKVVKHTLTENDNEIVSIEYSENKIQFIAKIEDAQIQITLTSENGENEDITTVNGIIIMDDETLPFKFTETMSENNNIITDNAILEIRMDDSNVVKLISNNKIEILDNVEIGNITENNSAKLNDMTSEEISTLMDLFSKKIQIVIQKKSQELMSDI